MRGWRASAEMEEWTEKNNELLRLDVPPMFRVSLGRCCGCGKPVMSDEDYLVTSWPHFWHATCRVDPGRNPCHALTI
jgi:hypothetical protein